MTQKKEKKKRVEIASQEISGELNEPRWAVITFEKCAAKNLTYAQAELKIAELAAQKVSGLCLVPNEVAEKL